MGKVVRAFDDVDAVLTQQLVEPLFQPIVALADQRPVGFEALSRGPEGDLHEASALFAAAAREGRSAELDRLCSRIAGQCFREADIPDLALFLNVNPETLAVELPGDLAQSYAELAQERDVVVEITEQAVMRQPVRLLEAVRDSRRRTARIALDDIGVEPAGLAAMPLTNPDIVKLDRSIVQGRTNSRVATPHLVDAVVDEARRQGAQILAEGIERPEDIAAARSLGATLGQGWFFGRPGPLPHHVRRSAQPLARVGPRPVSTTTPFELLAKTSEVRTTSPELFAAMAAEVENQAAQATGPGILAVNDGDGDGDAHDRYARLSRRGLDIVFLGSHLRLDVGGRVRCIPLADTDPLVQERSVLFVGTRDGSGAFARRAAHRRDGSVDAFTCYHADRVIKAMLTLVPRYADFPR